MILDLRFANGSMVQPSSPWETSLYHMMMKPIVESRNKTFTWNKSKLLLQWHKHQQNPYIHPCSLWVGDVWDYFAHGIPWKMFEGPQLLESHDECYAVKFAPWIQGTAFWENSGHVWFSNFKGQGCNHLARFSCFSGTRYVPQKDFRSFHRRIHRFPLSTPATTRGFRLQKGSCLHGESLVLIGEGWPWLVIIWGCGPPNPGCQSPPGWY